MVTMVVIGLQVIFTFFLGFFPYPLNLSQWMSISLVYKRGKLHKPEKEEKLTPLQQLIKHFNNARWENPRDIGALSPPLWLRLVHLLTNCWLFSGGERNNVGCDSAFFEVFAGGLHLSFSPLLFLPSFLPPFSDAISWSWLHLISRWSHPFINNLWSDSSFLTTPQSLP